MGNLARGYTFTDGVVDDCSSAHLHQLVESSVIQTSFHTDKSSAGADPDPATHEVMLYRSSDQTFRKGTLAAAIFDSSKFLVDRTAKTAPVAADLVLVGDSAAANALKKMTVANLLFGAAAWPAEALDGVNDLLVAYNASDSTIRKMALSKLFLLAPSGAGAFAATDVLALCTSAGALRQITLAELILRAPANAFASGADQMVCYSATSAAYMRITMAEWITGLAATLVTPAGTDLIQVSTGGSTLKKMAMSDVRAYAASLNIISTTSTAATTIATAGTSVWSLTALSATITPRSATSRILVRVVFNGCAAGNSTQGALGLQKTISGATTFVTQGDAAGVRQQCVSAIVNSTEPHCSVVEFLDSPATTLAVNYRAIVNGDASTTIYVNRGSTDANNAVSDRCVSSITVTEIPA